MYHALYLESSWEFLYKVSIPFTKKGNFVQNSQIPAHLHHFSSYGDNLKLNIIGHFNWQEQSYHGVYQALYLECSLEFLYKVSIPFPKKGNFVQNTQIRAH